MKRSTIMTGLVLPALFALSACGGDPTDRAAAARQAFAGEDFAGARANALAALEADGSNKDLLALLARAQLQLGDGDGAQGTLTRLKQTGASGPDVARMLAEAALLRGQARQVFELLGSDAAPGAWRLRAAAHIASDEPAAALDAFRKGMAAGADFLLARDYTRFLLDAQDNAGAAQALDAMRKLGPDRLDTLMLAGDLALRQGRQDDAAASWTRASERFAARVEPLLSLATLADMRGKVNDAAALVAKAEKIAPKDARVAAMVVQIAAEKGEWDKVRTALAPRESSLDPRSFEGLAYAEALLRLDHPEQARAMFAKALSLSPQNPYARIMLAEAQLATGDGATAFRTVRPLADSVLAGERELDLAVSAGNAARDPAAAGYEARLHSPQLREWQRLAGTGQAAIARGEWAAAIDAYRGIPGYDGDAEVLKRIAFASSNAGRHADAIVLADKALLIEPRNPDMLHIAGLVRLNAGKERDTAARLMQQAVELDPRNKVFRGDLARVSAMPG
ncbi:MAG: hypothetical protein RIS94_2915 [Pseudomonadota bacterium]|jgi:tetratricopeptide (TPR) repeat protein